MITTLNRIASPFALALVLAGIVSASDRFLQRVKLPSGRFAVVAEGDFEPRALGSYSVRLYSGKNPEVPFDDFVSGVLRERPDGFIEKVVLADIDGDSRPEIVVIFRCVGSGQYLSAEAFSADKKGLHLRATVTDLASNADPVKALKMKKRSKT